MKNNNKEDVLIHSEDKYLNLYKTMSLGVVYQNTNGEITDANNAAQEILGLSLEQLQGKKSVDPSWKALNEDRTEFKGEDHPAMVSLKTGKRVNNIIMGIHNPKDNLHRWILVSAVPQFKKGTDKPFAVYSTFQDITRLKETENKLEERAKELEKLNELMVDRELKMKELKDKIKELQRK